MHKQEFLSQLQKRLSRLPQDEILERMTFYSEMIDDRMEDGLSEQEAVASVGSLDQIVAQIVAEIPYGETAAKKAETKRRRSAVEIVLLVLGAPIWASLLISLFAVVLSVYLSLWSVVISLWAVFGALAGGSLAGLLAGAVLCLFRGAGIPGMALCGAGLVLAGLSILMFCACRALTGGYARLSGKLLAWIWNRCFKRRR